MFKSSSSSDLRLGNEWLSSRGISRLIQSIHMHRSGTRDQFIAFITKKMIFQDEDQGILSGLPFKNTFCTVTWGIGWKHNSVDFGSEYTPVKVITEFCLWTWRILSWNWPPCLKTTCMLRPLTWPDHILQVLGCSFHIILPVYSMHMMHKDHFV